jgi:hypothetical protein
LLQRYRGRNHTKSRRAAIRQAAALDGRVSLRESARHV